MHFITPLKLHILYIIKIILFQSWVVKKQNNGEMVNVKDIGVLGI